MVSNKILERVTSQLKEKDSKLSGEELTKVALKISEQVETKQNKKRDEKGRTIVAENVRLIIDGAISSVTE